MSAAHTPGPWQVSGIRALQPPRIGPDTRILNVGPDGDYLAMVFFDMNTGRGQADARLIASAPELLAALEGDIDWLDALSQMSIERDMVMVRIRAHRELIAKALGRTPNEIGDGCE